MGKRQREKAKRRREENAARGPHASLKHLRISPRKVRLVADMIRGEPIEKALNYLTFSPKRAAVPVKKLLNSALANADQRDDIDIDELVVKTIFVDEGSTWRRWLPRAMGRATRLRKRHSHVTIELGEQ
jgi:large subunit ribosomal protein L22